MADVSKRSKRWKKNYDCKKSICSLLSKDLVFGVEWSNHTEYHETAKNKNQNTHRVN